MGLQFADIDDAVNTTQQNLVKRGSFVDMQTDLTDHVLVRELWKSKQHKFVGGDDWRFDAQIDHNYSARSVEMYESDGTSLTDTMINGLIQPRHINAHYIYDHREKDFQRGGLAIVDYIKTKYVAMMVSFFEYLETVGWGKPATSADAKTPYGVAYWVTPCAAGEEGFLGVNPTGFTSGRAGISTGDYARWANWAADYVAIEKQDLIRKMRKAHRNIQFRSVVSHAEPVLGEMRNGIYTNDTVIGLMEEILEAQNMNLGNDLASKDGRTLFKSTPITYAPKLDANTYWTDPVLMLDWKWMAFGVLAGWEDELTAPYMLPNKHLVRRVDKDVTVNLLCTNLRKQAVMSKVT